LVETVFDELYPWQYPSHVHADTIDFKYVFSAEISYSSSFAMPKEKKAYIVEKLSTLTLSIRC
jgi:hypothetical protein